MIGILRSLLQVSGLTAAEIDQLFAILRNHVPALATMTIILAGSGLFVSGYVQHWFHLRGKELENRRAREERIKDITLATYNEMAIDLKITIESFDLSRLEAATEKMLFNHKFFPIWTSSKDQLYIFDNYIKKDIAILSSRLIGPTVEFYQSALYLMAYLDDTRHEVVKNLSSERKIAFLRRMHRTAYNHMQITADALIAYESWLYGCKIYDLVKMDWIKNVPALASSRAESKHLADRLGVYEEISRFAIRQRDAVDQAIKQAASSRPEGRQGYAR